MTQFDKLYTSREKLVKTVLSLTEQVNQGGGGGSSSSIEPKPIQSSELKTLRDKGQLTPGCLYRITDYETTTSQYNTQSAGHVFDIIVLALDNKTLSEEAWACHSERDNVFRGMEISFTGGGAAEVTKFIRSSDYDGEYNEEFYYAFASDGIKIYTKSLEEEPTTSTIFVFLNKKNQPTTVEGGPTSVVSLSDFASQFGGSVEITDLLRGYFALSKLEAWKLWYCLDNDTSRFAWAKNDNDHRLKVSSAGPNGRRDSEHDLYGFCAWRFSDRETYYMYTFNENPNVGDLILGSVMPEASFTIASIDDNTITTPEVPSLQDLEGNYDLYSKTFTRAAAFDQNGFYAWQCTELETWEDIVYTSSENPSVGDPIIAGAGSVGKIIQKSWGGKGVIYRMIDEFGNDCPYDFKNIQNILPINDNGFVDQSGTNKPCYTFDQGSRDYSITGEATNNVIGSRYEFGNYYIPIVRMGSGNGNRIGVNCNRIYLGAMDGANVCQYVTNVDYQTAGRDTYRMYEWFGRARNGSVVQTNIFGTET